MPRSGDKVKMGKVLIASWILFDLGLFQQKTLFYF